MIHVLIRFRRYMRPFQRVLAAGCVLAVVDVALGLAQPWPLKVIVDNVLKAHGRGDSTVTGFWFEASPRTILAFAVVLLVVVVASAGLADYWSTWFMESAGQRVGNKVREAVFAHLQRLSLRYHGKHSVGDLTARVTADVDRVQDLLVQVFSVLVPNVLLLIGMVTVMAFVDPVFTALALAVSPPLIFAIYRSANGMKQASRRARHHDGAIAAAATEHLGAIQVVQGFSLEYATSQHFETLNQASLDAYLEAARHSARFGPMVDFAAAISTAVVLWFGANQVLSHQMSLGVLLVFVAYVGSMYKPVRALSKLGYVFGRGIACAERLDAILREEPDVVDRPGAQHITRVRGAVAFEHVSYSYGRGPVLQDVSLTAQEGEVLAIVGPTGAGKSTLMSLIPRFFDPDEGRVCVGGIDVRDFTVSSLREQVALVLQDSVLFRGTIWDNIALGRIDATPSDVLAAATHALVDEFAERLPDGLHTTVGERGASLSGGQRQRIAIARAIVRDAPILLLDEPTSALDAGSEALVVEALQNLMQGRTTIVIAHRLSTVRHADRIVVLAGGRIVEVGTHDQLIAAQGAFATLSALQAPTPAWNDGGVPHHEAGVLRIDG